MESDETLYRSYLSGNDDALRILLERYRDRLTFFLLGFVGNVEDAEDIMIDTFAVLLSKDKTFAGRSTFKTWLFAIGRNQAKMFLRKKHTVFVSFEESKAEIFSEAADLHILQEENSRRLLEYLDRLKPEYREALMLSYFEDMTREQISAVMKISKHQASDLLYRGKLALKALLEREEISYAEFGYAD